MDKYLVDIKEMEQLLSMANPLVSKNVIIETPETLGQDKLYHIALYKQAILYPNISRRAGTTEDNTLPRVHVSTSIEDCWYGYEGGGHIASTQKVSVEKDKAPINGTNRIYKGGFYIHEIPFRCALKPNKKLVYDAMISNERWLPSYNLLTKSYPATAVGLLIPIAVVYTPVSGAMPIEKVTLCIHIKSANGVKLLSKESKVGTLPAGYWLCTISTTCGVEDIKNITKKEYNEYKLKSAGLLSF